MLAAALRASLTGESTPFALPGGGDGALLVGPRGVAGGDARLALRSSSRAVARERRRRLRLAARPTRAGHLVGLGGFLRDPSVASSRTHRGDLVVAESDVANPAPDALTCCADDRRDLVEAEPSGAELAGSRGSRLAVLCLVVDRVRPRSERLGTFGRSASVAVGADDLTLLDFGDNAGECAAIADERGHISGLLPDVIEVEDDDVRLHAVNAGLLREMAQHPRAGHLTSPNGRAPDLLRVLPTAALRVIPKARTAPRLPTSSRPPVELDRLYEATTGAAFGLAAVPDDERGLSREQRGLARATRLREVAGPDADGRLRDLQPTRDLAYPDPFGTQSSGFASEARLRHENICSHGRRTSPTLEYPRRDSNPRNLLLEREAALTASLRGQARPV